MRNNWSNYFSVLSVLKVLVLLWESWNVQSEAVHSCLCKYTSRSLQHTHGIYSTWPWLRLCLIQWSFEGSTTGDTPTQHPHPHTTPGYQWQPAIRTSPVTTPDPHYQFIKSNLSGIVCLNLEEYLQERFRELKRENEHRQAFVLMAALLLLWIWELPVSPLNTFQLLIPKTPLPLLSTARTQSQRRDSQTNVVLFQKAAEAFTHSMWTTGKG